MKVGDLEYMSFVNVDTFYSIVNEETAELICEGYRLDTQVICECYTNVKIFTYDVKNNTLIIYC